MLAHEPLDGKNPVVRAFLLSVFLHCVLVAVLVFFAGELFKRTHNEGIITVFLGAQDQGGPTGGLHGHGAPSQSKGAARHPIQPYAARAGSGSPSPAGKEGKIGHGEIIGSVMVDPSAFRLPGSSAPADTASDGNHIDVPGSRSEVRTKADTGQGGVLLAGRNAASGGRVGSSADGNDGPWATPGDAPTRYGAAQFAYIRTVILKNLAYPPGAKRMGLKGIVTVDFVILENGLVQNVKIMESSGYDMLDRSVIETIRRSQPFPKPPVKAELKIPIVFRLQ